MERKTVLITGATSGIGRAAAIALLLPYFVGNVNLETPGKFLDAFTGKEVPF